MSFTRHKTKSQLRKYLRGIGASLAKDYSNKYTIDIPTNGIKPPSSDGRYF